jgi:hypothetical protein
MMRASLWAMAVMALGVPRRAFQRRNQSVLAAVNGFEVERVGQHKVQIGVLAGIGLPREIT